MLTATTSTNYSTIDSTLSSMKIPIINSNNSEKSTVSVALKKLVNKLISFLETKVPSNPRKSFSRTRIERKLNSRNSLVMLPETQITRLML